MSRVKFLISGPLCKAVNEKLDDKQAAKVKSLCSVHFTGTCSGFDTILYAMEPELLRENARVTICCLMRGSIQSNYVFFSSEEEALQKVSAIPARKKSPTPRKVLVNMGVSRARMFNQKVRVLNSVHGNVVCMTELTRADIVGRNLSINVSWNVKRLYESMRAYLDRNDVTDDILEEVWKLVDVEGVMSQ